ncbi:DNA phosphorothioation system sulfurtransferase DndC [Citrifermentans bremense]|uniref:DNA phosphorothioation system sulfurtransferase DndC n=1 Tax=Citrifermentans bremense TaxID=60035 RepID=UPI0004038FEC|nr:DNA phosphorothioation system sulfurtransferase DndC [Citrifermentans bremense]
MDKITEIKEHIKRVYLAYNRPFVVGYSGGKDSTVVLQLVWDVIEELPREQLTQDVHVISTDTLVETPYIIDYVTKTLEQVNKASSECGLPIKAHRLTPLNKNSFWVNLIGKGYPAPSRNFRWCTERLKIEPVNRFIAEHVDEWGEATVLLGARRDESASRSQVLAKKVRDQMGLSKHPTLPAAFVFTPIEEMTTDDVWSYLLNHKCQWGGNNRDLAAMYQNAAGGECPMVVDKSTPSCGSSRFGCWTCTLVQQDSTMENLIDNGEEWMAPLLEFRDFLSETQDPEKKHIYRSHKRRDGQVAYVRDGTRIAYGPYKLEWRKEFLKRLLTIQKDVQQNGPDPSMQLIAVEELELIRDFWREEEWSDSVPEIYREVIGADHVWPDDDGIRYSLADHELLTTLCRQAGINPDLPTKLLDQERRLQGMTRRAGILDKIDRIFAEEWRTEEEVLKELEAGHDI